MHSGVGVENIDLGGKSKKKSLSFFLSPIFGPHLVELGGVIREALWFHSENYFYH